MAGTLIIRSDAAPHIGTGHVMRCIALACAAREQGLDVMLSGRMGVDWLKERLRATGLPFRELPGNVPQRELPADLLAQLSGSAKDWVVLDGYHFGPDFHKAISEAGYKLLVVDDYCHLPEYNCDILFNQNIGAEKLQYQGNLGQKLLGPRYAMLRPEFLASRKRATQRQFPPKARHILLSLGGGDFSNELEGLAPLLVQKELAGTTLRVIAGAMPEAQVRSILADCPASLEVLTHVDDMPSLMHWADLCVSAGGSTCWELCCLGVPFLTIEIANNQREIVKGLATLGVAPVLELETLRYMITDADARRVASAAGLAIVDGNGAARVIAMMCKSPCLLREAEPRDCSFVWQVAGASEVRAVSGSTLPIPWETHKTWYSARLMDAGTHFYIIENPTATPLGYMRFQKDGDAVIVSIALTAKARSRGVGTHALREGCRLVREYWPNNTVQAYIAPENEASRKAFSRAGFAPGSEVNLNGRTMVCFTY